MTCEPRPEPRALPEAGFTLVEMLVVLTLVALLSVVAIGQLSHRPAFVTKAATLTDLHDRIGQGRQQAARSGVPVVLAPGTLGQGITYRPGGQPTAGDGLTLYPDGSTSGGTLLIEDRPVAIVDWLTGEVRDAAR